jgi:hypothetical protein
MINVPENSQNAQYFDEVSGHVLVLNANLRLDLLVRK